MQNSLNLKKPKVSIEAGSVSEDNVLVAITASREKGEIVYRVECASNLSKEEFEYYLSEIIKGICEWKKSVCDEHMGSFEGKIEDKK